MDMPSIKLNVYDGEAIFQPLNYVQSTGIPATVNISIFKTFVKISTHFYLIIQPCFRECFFSICFLLLILNWHFFEWNFILVQNEKKTEINDFLFFFLLFYIRDIQRYQTRHTEKQFSINFSFSSLYFRYFILHKQMFF